MDAIRWLGDIAYCYKPFGLMANLSNRTRLTIKFFLVILSKFGQDDERGNSQAIRFRSNHNGLAVFANKIHAYILLEPVKIQGRLSP